jgi:hypothetical protein
MVLNQVGWRNTKTFHLETFAIAKFGTNFCNGHLPPITNFVKIFWVASFVMFEKNSFLVPL